VISRNAKPRADYEDDDHCYVCGMTNSDGLRLKFELDSEDTLKASFTPTRTHQGFKNVMHGGVLALLFDEMMVNLPWKLGKRAVSAQIQVRLKRPVAIGTRIDFRCQIKKEAGKLIFLKAKALDPQGVTVAEAEGTCVRIA
jgi:uncharacterized protein (TIGR00369 family)